MNKEELEKEAEEWVKKEYPTLEINAVAERYCKAYLAGAEPREKRIAELEAQIEGKENEFKYFSNSFKKKIAELKDYRLTTLAKQQTEMSKYALNLEHKLG